jgi:hypothetical protein
VDESKKAPHGYEDDGVTPRTPYGVNLDGTPRKSNRGARPGQRGNGNRARKSRPGVKATSATDAQRKQALCALGEMAVTGPLAALSMSPVVSKRFGKEQADALAGDAVILNEALPAVADGLIVLSQSKPGALAWLDQVEEKAPYLLLASVGVQVMKALVTNHMNPNPKLAEAGRLRARMQQEAMISAIEQQAAEMGININADEPTVPIPSENAA